jgi:hypothetical protein
MERWRDGGMENKGTVDTEKKIQRYGETEMEAWKDTEMKRLRDKA